MRHIALPSDPTSPLKILCLGAHADDIEIGCGGTVLGLSQQYPNFVLYWVVFSAIGVRAEEAKRSADLFVGSVAIGGPQLKSFKDGFMPYSGGEVKAVFEELKAISPDLIFTHNRHDAHQDHRLLAELTWNTFRDHLILEYEIPKYDGDMGQPNVFVPLSTDTSEKKAAFLKQAFRTQASKQWFSDDTFLALTRLRGVEASSPTGFAEAFYARKINLQWQ